MPQRKPWTADEDKILKYLKDERGEKKWSLIAKAMDIEFGIKGKTGKQCRERYHNHLDETIITTEWTHKQEEILFEIHESVGNKWSLISQQLPGRSDNCVKNHFYSKLRKGVRKLNKLISQHFKKQFRQIKMVLLYKIIQTTQLRFQEHIKHNHEFIDLCRGLKNDLFLMNDFIVKDISLDQLSKFKSLIVRIHQFEQRSRKNARKQKEHKGSTETNYSNNAQKKQKVSEESIDDLPFYEIFKKVCDQIMLNPE